MLHAHATLSLSSVHQRAPGLLHLLATVRPAAANVCVRGLVTLRLIIFWAPNLSLRLCPPTQSADAPPTRRLDQTPERRG